MQTTSPLNQPLTQEGLTAAPAAGAVRRVTDAPTRMFHWLFALSFLGAYVTADGERFRLLHVTLGYTMVGLLAFRLLYGWVGPRQLAMGVLWRKLSSAPRWLATTLSARSLGEVNWRQGQNLLMAGSVAASLLLVIPLTLSGHATYQEWGDILGVTLGGEWLEELHEFFGEGLLMVVLAHVGLVLALSVLRRKNQALPMLTGCAEGPGPSLIKANRAWLAALLLMAAVAFGVWMLRG
jgi:cytochrome b